jgi:hypothetical protein
MGIILVGTSAAQDTNFSTGPQYLMTFGSPLFARPIATPSLSLDSLPFPEPSPTLVPEVSPTPAVGPASETVATTRTEPQYQINLQPNLFPIFYGRPRLSAVAVSFNEPGEEESASSRPIPAGFADSSVVALVDVQSLRERGYGITLPEAARHRGAHKASAAHHYTNGDIERLHSRP